MINIDSTMEKIKVDRMECHYPALFKVMWLSTVIWIAMSIANYFGIWMIPSKLYNVGMSILLLFAVSLVICFKKGLRNLINQHGVFQGDSWSRKVVTYSFLLSFVVMLVLSIWDLCATTGEEQELARNGVISSITIGFVFIIVGDVFKAAIVSIVSLILYWYIKMCFVLFYGHIRKLGVEMTLGLIMMAFLAISTNYNLWWVNTMVVLIVAIFLYDIWRFADFQASHLSVSDIKKFVEDLENEE